MRTFHLTQEPIRPDAIRNQAANPAAGALVTFEGWVRDHNEGRTVERLEYDAYPALALAEGAAILAEAVERFGVYGAECVHRTGKLEIGEIAVIVVVTSAHRDEAFAACRYIIDEVKARVPIWKKEYYSDGDSGWVNCPRCAAHAHSHGQVHAHESAD